MNAKERLPAVGLLAALLLPIVNGLVVSAQAPSRALEASPHARPGGSAATPLHEAAARGNIPVLAALTESGTNLESRNELGLTPLQVAVLRGHLAAAALLVDKGADVRARDAEGNTLLHRILLKDRVVMVQDRPPTNWLARLGSDPRRETYLKYLDIGEHQEEPNPLLETVSFLLACGLDATTTNSAGRTVMQLATDEEVTEKLFLFDDDERGALLKLLATSGGNVNETDANGDTALHRAGQDLLADGVARLVACGADVNATNRQGRTPLHKFAEHLEGWDLGGGSNRPFQFLLTCRPNVNAQDHEGLTPLHVVAAADTFYKAEAIGALLDAGASPNLRDNQGRTPVHILLSGRWPWSGASAGITRLAKAGADLSAKDRQGRTPLHYLAALGHSNPLFFIRDVGDVFASAKVDVEPRDAAGDTPLHVAARAGTKDVFDWLVRQGASLDATNHAGETPRLLAARSTDLFARFRQDPETDIIRAAREGRLESVAALLKADPSLLNSTNLFEQTPLRAAVLARHTNVIEFLDRQGVRWDAVSAVLAGRPEKVKAVLAQNPAAAAETFNGKSLLHLVAARGLTEIAATVMAAGANLQATDPWGLSPLGEALRNGQNQAADFLRRQGARDNIFDAVYAGDLSAAERLLSADKALAGAASPNGLTLVEVAAELGDAPMLNLLLDKGASARSVNERDGRTPLHAAAVGNCTSTAELLIRHGAELEVPDAVGFTPLHLAAWQGASEVAVLLLKHKADPDVRVAWLPAPQPAPVPGRFQQVLAGCTPLHLAALAGRTNLIELLLKSGAEVNATNAMGSTALDLVNPRPDLPVEMLWVLLEHRVNRLPPRVSDAPAARAPALFYERRRAAAAVLENSGGRRSTGSSSVTGPPRW